MGLRTGTDQNCQISRAADSQILIRKDSVSSRSEIWWRMGSENTQIERTRTAKI